MLRKKLKWGCKNGKMQDNLDRQTKHNQLIRFGNLDIIKIISATLIVFHHYQQLSGSVFSGINFYGGKFNWGYLVELFFLISGFLTTYSDSKKKRTSSFFRHKLIRILPAAWLSMSFYLFVTIAYKIILGTYLWDEKLDMIHIMSSFLMVNQGWMLNLFPAVNNPTWYLDVLILCYIIYYCIRKFVKSSIIRSFTYCVIILLAISGNFLGVQIPFFWFQSKRGYVAFFAGLLICELYVTFGKKLKYSLVLLAPLSIAGSLFRGLSDWYSLVLFVFPMMIIIAISLPQVHHKIVDTMGAIAFEVYLWHTPLLKFVILICDAVGYSIEHSYLSMIIFCFFVWGVAMLIYHFFEKPVGIWLKTKMKIK